MTFEKYQYSYDFSPDLYTTTGSITLKITLASPTDFLPSTIFQTEEQREFEPHGLNLYGC